MGDSWKRLWPRRAPRPEEVQCQELEESLEHTRMLIAQAYAGFNTAADSELVESYVYEIQALRARYSYLLRQRKALEQTAKVSLIEPVRSALPAV